MTLLVPTTSIEYSARVVDGATLTVRVVVAVPSGGGVTEGGLKEQVIPGTAAHERLTGLLKALIDWTVIVLVADPPAGMSSEDGSALAVNSLTRQPG
jgi:hypothetical protein